MESRQNATLGDRPFAQRTEAHFRNLDTTCSGSILRIDPRGDPGRMATTQQPRTVPVLGERERIEHLLVLKGNPPDVGGGWASRCHAGVAIGAFFLDQHGHLPSSRETFDRAYAIRLSTFNAGAT